MTNKTQSRQRLTPRQLQILRSICSSASKSCYSPTIAELAAQLGISRSTVFEHTTELLKKDLLSRSPGKARSLTPTTQALELLEDLGDNRCESESTSASRTTIPLVGRVAAGVPIEAVENREEVSLGDYFGSGENVFALEVKGDSMIDENIHDGDTVVCRKSASAKNGDLVVATVEDEEATLKRFYKEENRIRLQPANENYEPILTNNCRIEGIVLGLLRKL